jgi:hypothetical protein
MSYLTQSLLAQDQEFIGRSTSVATEQSAIYVNDARPDFIALSEAVLKGSHSHIQAFVRFNSVGSGVGNKVDNGDGSIDQSQVTDGDLLSLTQNNFPIIANLYFNDDGSPKI